jgi:hypothetical protein
MPRNTRGIYPVTIAFTVSRKNRGRTVNHQEAYMSFNVTEKEFEETLRRRRFPRKLKILQGALTAGVIIFGGVVIGYAVASGSRAADQEPGGIPLDILSIVHFLLAVGMWTAAPWIFAYCLRTGWLTAVAPDHTSLSGLNPANPADRCLLVILGATVLRLAMLEGAALLGLVICLLGAVSGEIYARPIYWLNATSALAFVLFSAWTFPGRDRLMDTFRMKLAGSPDRVEWE